MPDCLSWGRRRTARGRWAAPSVSVGTPKEYAVWAARGRAFLAEMGRSPDSLERVDAAINYRRNHITLFRLQDPARELSVADTLAHEWLHAVLDELGEGRAARELDRVVRPVGDPGRTGGV
jgi:hypothetical protein